MTGRDLRGTVRAAGQLLLDYLVVAGVYVHGAVSLVVAKVNSPRK